MDKRLHFAGNWSDISCGGVKKTIREYLDNGVKHFAITGNLLKKMLISPETVRFFRDTCKEMQVCFNMTHGLFGPDYDLNNVDEARRPAMWEEHRQAMEAAVSFGCRTYVIHVGAYAHCTQKIPLEILRPLAVETLEKLLPAAEKLGIIIAVENSFEPSNSVGEIMGLIAPFKGNPFIGLCYDTGHANCMASAPGKERGAYHSSVASAWKDTGIIFEDNAFELMKEHIVTCHIHDNNGYSDQHGLPFDGTIDWDSLMPKLLECPGIIDFYAEICMNCGENWAGKLLAPAGGYSIRKTVETFQHLGF